MNIEGISEDSILSFTPDKGWKAVFTDKESGEQRELPVIGWAVVRGADYDDEPVSTSLYPVVLEYEFLAILPYEVTQAAHETGRVVNYTIVPA